jgi:hypothetical protein
MPVKESSAALLVRFTGLGIVCFNPQRQRCEIAALRDERHLLSVVLQRPVYQDGAEQDLITYQDVAVYRDLPKEDVRIEIKALAGAAVDGYEIYRPGNFDRLNAADVNDFGWIVKMEALHGDAPLGPTGQSPYPLTKIYIENGFFYTHKLATDFFFEKVRAGAGGTGLTGQREAFGSVGETVGVKIEADEVSFSIGVGGRVETHTLTRVDGVPHRLKIMNMDYGEDAVYSDMADYYGYLSSPTGERFDLSPVVEDGAAGGGSINQKQFCHPITTDLPTIDQL